MQHRRLAHLDRRFPRAPLFGAAPAQRAMCEVFCDWFDRVWKVEPNAIDAELDAPAPDAARLADPEEGHFGLRVLADLATDAGAVLQVASRPGAGTDWRLAMEPEEAT